ncbi:12911_t:CDS:2 [Gigaspora margarita]|uniref:12911_t:CDS:1 n=1 Tax=Gigaspora margarita TaxID=4874 RepID=A0ABN7UQ26_GIGMA|nr:12911_t:CDS:2 [Gigaspora margarita]
MSLSLSRYVDIYGHPLGDFDLELTNENSRNDINIEANGNPKNHLNHHYAVYLKTQRELHNQMLYNIVHKADSAVANTSVYSVTLKPQLAPSNDPHDYMSLARYYWPNPNTKDGLPYISRDGHTNPEIYTIKDYAFLRNLMTKMNPNLKYASLVKGKKLGRRAGILDTRPIYKITQSIPLMRSSKFWDYNIELQLKNWFTEFYDWFKNSKFGREEHNAKNNHGTFYDVQAIHILEYIGKINEAKDFAQKALIHRVNTGILADGQQPYETVRTLSWQYSIFNVQALFLLAERATHLGFDGWNYRGNNNQSIKTAVDYLLPYALNGGKGWKFKNIGGFGTDSYERILELSWIIWGDNKYPDAVEILKQKAKKGQTETSLCIWSMANDKQILKNTKSAPFVNAGFKYCLYAHTLALALFSSYDRLYFDLTGLEISARYLLYRVSEKSLNGISPLR